MQNAHKYIIIKQSVTLTINSNKMINLYRDTKHKKPLISCYSLVHTGSAA